MTPTIDARDSGWVISKGSATHYPCNEGFMVARNMDLIVGHLYVIAFVISAFVSGVVRVICGDTLGTPRNVNGTYTETLTCTDVSTFKFYADGQLTVSDLYIYDTVQPSQPITFSFNEKHNLWSNVHSFVPDTMVSFLGNFYSWYHGAMYLHNSDAAPRMNYYGTQYSAQITFYMNSEASKTKIASGIRILSNKVWSVPNIKIKPYTGKSLGMMSRLKTGRFEVLQGEFYADFLKNMLDPRFDTQLKALMYGEELRGRVMEVTIQQDSTEEVILFSVDIEYYPQQLTS